jgi:carbon monoxide dehydrogenase subunit G
VSSRYVFDGSWLVPAPPEQVQPVLLDLERYPEWWPQVRAVAWIDDDTARVLCRSTLPYTLDLVLHAVRREPQVLETRVTGDLDGSVRWLIGPEGDGTRLELEQQVEVTGALAVASYAARPLLRWNHDRMLAGGIAGLCRRLR